MAALGIIDSSKNNHLLSFGKEAFVFRGYEDEIPFILIEIPTALAKSLRILFM